MVLICFGMATLGLSGCSSECTEADLKAKLEALSGEIEHLAKSGDMKALQKFSQKAAAIYQSTQNKDDMQAACEAVDDLLGEF